MERVFVTRRLPPETLQPLQGLAELGVWPEEERPVPRAVLEAEAARAAALLIMLTDRVDAALLAGAPLLRVVSTMSVGTDHVDVAACTARRVAVCHTPDVLTETTADLVFALVLATARRLCEGQRAVAEGRWGAWAPFFLAGRDVHHATLGIVGLGRVGQAVARRAQGFAMRVLYTARRPKPEAEALGAQWASLDTLLQESDFVVLVAALTAETRHLIGARELARMKRTAVLVNAGRGALVDEQALVEALRAERIWGAGLDVFAQEPLPPDHPLLRLPRVLTLPHIGSATVATRLAMAHRAVENLAAVLRGHRPPACVNPEVLPS